MTVREILTDSAVLLGRTDISEHLKTNGTDEKLEKECENLLRLYNMVESEIAVCYKPLKIVQEIVVTGGYVPYSAFSKSPVDVEKVLNGSVSQTFVLTVSGVNTDSGTLKFIYKYLPSKKSLDDECEYKTGEERAIVLGVACEYSLATGLYEQAVTWDKRYKDALASACSEKGGIMKMRRWF